LAKSKKPKRNTELLAEINEISNELLLRELKHFRDSGERCPSALLTTAATLMKFSGVQEEIEREAQQEVQATAATNFVTRLTPEYLAAAGLRPDDEPVQQDDEQYASSQQ